MEIDRKNQENSKIRKIPIQIQTDETAQVDRRS